MSMIQWDITHAALWRARRQLLKAVSETDLDTPPLASLLGIASTAVPAQRASGRDARRVGDQDERQKAALLDNLCRFTKGQSANHALLWGSRGCGKSSLVKAVFGVLRHEGLRLVQVDKEDLLDLPDLVDALRHQPHRFLMFCDDLSFQPGEPAFRALKTVLDGSIERPPENILLVATSNRRHLVPERMADNLAATHVEGELHLGDASEEQLALADRFGLWLSFYPPDQDTFLAMVEGRGVTLDAQARLEAIRFATTRGGRSGCRPSMAGTLRVRLPAIPDSLPANRCRAARQFGQSRSIE
ncbi:MAG: ATP-binding protein [Pseudomonadota bacterium]